ncbi:MAG TPA: helix-turn-helix domain-containing protein [Propionibacteriaceae bacterium]|nr:helix-turn-helix domain-containing protein [Propionibacteriaceae bacterium]
MDRPSTGIDALDEVLGGLGVGDNVVWQAADPADIEPFVGAFLATAHGTTPLTYLSFRLPPAAVLDRFSQVWDSDRFTLLDGWTGSQHASSEPSVAVAGLPPQALVRRLKDPADMEQVNRELSEIEDELGPGARYVFDDLTSMQRLWGPEPALALFLRCCPRLYQERTVAYWLLERDAHPPTFRSQLADITQVILDLDTTATQPAERTLQVVKADGHSPAVLGRTLRYAVGDNGAIDVLRTASGTRERIGEQIRAERIATGLSQAELARRIGVSPSALSQVERGRHGLSGETLTRLWATLGIPYGPAASPASPPYRLTRRGARQPVAPAPGVSGETVLQEPSGLGMHELTFPAGSSGRRPFETKQPELLLILEGALELQLGQDSHTLQQGDAILLATQPVTGWRNPAREPARVLWLLLRA